ncbi:hypothetical protein D3C76_205090 [compost metagenome]
MFLVLLQHDILSDFTQFTIHTHTDKALLRDIGKQALVFPFAAGDHRRQNLQPGFLGILHNPVYHLLNRLGSDFDAMIRAMRMPNPGKQQPQIVIDFCYRAHGRTRVAACCLLVDGYCRGQPVNGVDIRLLHLPEELPCIGRQGFHITALSLSVDRIERQRRFAGAAKSRQHDEAVTRNRYVNVLEIVCSRTFDYNIFVRQRYNLLKTF